MFPWGKGNGMDVETSRVTIIRKQKHGEILSSIDPPKILASMERDSLLRMLGADTGTAVDALVTARAHLRGAITRPLEMMRKLIMGRDPTEHVSMDVTIGNRALHLSQGREWGYEHPSGWRNTVPRCTCTTSEAHTIGSFKMVLSGDGIENHTKISKWCGTDTYSVTSYCDGGPVAWSSRLQYPDGLTEPELWTLVDAAFPAPEKRQCLFCGTWCQRPTETGGWYSAGMGEESWVCPKNPGDGKDGDRTHLVGPELPLVHDVTRGQAAVIISQQRFMDRTEERVLCPQLPDAYPHDHHTACPECGDVHRNNAGTLDRVMGGVMVGGAEWQECAGCGKQLRFMPNALPTMRF